MKSPKTFYILKKENVHIKSRAILPATIRRQALQADL